MKTWSLALFVVGMVAVPAAAQDAAKTAFERKAVYPSEGEVSVERLNVRMFPKSDQSSIITSVLGLGEKVTVVADKEEYFQILPPRGSTVWVFGRNLKREGDVATVTANDVPCRLDSRVNADVLCTLKEGDTVKIVSENFGWFKIEAPAAVKYYVGKKYVKVGGEVAVSVPAPIPAPRKDEGKRVAPRTGDSDAEARAILAVADLELEKQHKLIETNQVNQVDFSRVVESYEQARTKAETELVRAEAEKGLKRYRELNSIWTGIKRKIDETDRDVQAKIDKTNQKAVEPKGPTASGYIDTTGLLFKRPGTHKLVMGGKIVAFLRVKDGDDRMIQRLNDHYQKYVGINGTVIRNPDGWEGYQVVVVDDIVPIQQ